MALTVGGKGRSSRPRRGGWVNQESVNFTHVQIYALLHIDKTTDVLKLMKYNMLCILAFIHLGEA